MCTLVSSTSKKRCLIQDESKCSVQVTNMFHGHLNMILGICIALAATQAVAAYAVKEIFEFLVPPVQDRLVATPTSILTDLQGKVQGCKGCSMESPTQRSAGITADSFPGTGLL